MHVWVAKSPGTIEFLNDLYDDVKYQDDDEAGRTHARVHIHSTPVNYSDQLVTWGLKRIGDDP